MARSVGNRIDVASKSLGSALSRVNVARKKSKVDKNEKMVKINQRARNPDLIGFSSLDPRTYVVPRTTIGVEKLASFCQPVWWPKGLKEKRSIDPQDGTHIASRCALGTCSFFLSLLLQTR